MDILKVISATLFSAIALFFIAKAMGHKQMAQLDFFDYISGITIGSMAAEIATELERPWKPFIAIMIYGAISVGLSKITSKFPGLHKYINGTPTILMNKGKLYRRNMKKAKLDLSEFMVMCRQEGYFNINDIQTAIFEYNGKLTILPVSKKRPLTPEDMDMNVEQEHIQTEIIMDGQILGENLKRMGLDVTWLKKQLAAQGYHRAKDIYLGLCDENHRVSLFCGE